jgi:hypothetical protein
LWRDLGSLSKEEFVGELDGIFVENHATRVAPKFKKAVKHPRKFSSDDRPVTRIVFVLQDEKKLSNIEARSLLINDDYRHAAAQCIGLNINLSRVVTEGLGFQPAPWP